MRPYLFGLALFLGFRHGLDPDHLAAIDGLARLRNNRWNGVFFALGHSLVVTILAVGVDRFSTKWLEQLSPLLLIGIGALNLYRLLRRSPPHQHTRLISSSPFLLGIVFAAGFETASQLSVLALANQTNAWLLGAFFGLGMLLVDGIDGYNASNVQGRGFNTERAAHASQLLTVLVVITSFGLGFTALLNIKMGAWSLPIGAILFLSVLFLRIWGRGGYRLAELP